MVGWFVGLVCLLYREKEKVGFRFRTAIKRYIERLRLVSLLMTFLQFRELIELCLAVSVIVVVVVAKVFAPKFSL